MKDREVVPDSQYGFTNGKSHLTNIVTFCDGLTTPMDKGRATDAIFEDFCKALDMVTHNICLSEWERYGFNVWTFRWIRN